MAYKTGYVRRRSTKTVVTFVLLALLMATANAGDPPSFVVKPPPRKVARQGQSLFLKCRATGSPPPVISWRKDGILVKDGRGGILLSRGDLAVTSLTTSHRGRYTCHAQSLEGQITFSTDVLVEAPPEFEKTPSDLTILEGGDAMFECTATGYPSHMTYRWTYNGDPVELSGHMRGRYSVLSDGSLIIYNIDRMDRGNVSCTVENGFGPTSPKYAALHVEFPAKVSNMPAIAYAGSGLKATLRCSSEAEPPVNKVVWRKDDQRISSHQNPRVTLDGEGSLIVSSVNYGDAGRYTCTPYNIYGTLGESTGTELRIREPPEFIIVPDAVYEAELGKSISIPCRGRGDPPPAVTWRKVLRKGEGVHYKAENGNLTIRPVTSATHGTWQCILRNSVASVERNVEIYVKYTRPHEVTNVTARALSESAIRVSWMPGYNGGYPQSFIVWYRQANEEDPAWLTHDVPPSHTVAVLDGLEPNTEYEVAVLPENKIRSGPFSETVVARTRVKRPPIPRVPLLPPPQALFPSTTDAGLVQLTWRKPEPHQRRRGNGRGRIEIAPRVQEEQRIFGFLLEFRWTGVVESENLSLRKKRSAKIPAKDEWQPLETTYENVTKVVVKPEKLYRDFLYDFRVLAVSKNEYSPPSNPVSFSTKGLTAYPCYSGPLTTTAGIGNPVIVGVLVAVILILFVVGFTIYWCCRRRKKDKRHKQGDVVSLRGISTESTASVSHSGVNGKVIVNKQSIVVGIDEKGDYTTKKMREYGAVESDEEAKTPFIRDSNNIEESDKVFKAFMQKHNSDFDTGSRSPSDRSSVRLRRETAPRVLLEQYKRRSLTDRTFHKINRSMPLRGGTRSASTSPERNNPLARQGDLNTTAPAVLEDPSGRKLFRMYSQPLHDTGSAQQRRMIVIKRKSHKSSSSDASKKPPNGAPPSDSSESPVFGVVGTLKHRSDNSLDNVSPRTSSPIKRGRKSSPSRDHRHGYHRQPYDATTDNNNKSNVMVRSPGNESMSPLPDPIFASSPNDSSSPDVSPNRVVARRTVEYDPTADPTFTPNPYSGSPSKRDPHWRKANSLTHEQRAVLQPVRARSQTHRNLYPQSSFSNSPQHEHYDMPRAQHHFHNPGYQMLSHWQPRGRYSYAQLPQGHSHHLPTQGTQYHPSPPVHNASRSRASYSFGNRQPLALYSPQKVYDQAHHASHLRPSANANHSMHPVSPDRQPPTSTCEIDCSNSDIEVRFVKNPDGSGYSPVMLHDPSSGRGGMVSVHSSRTTPSKLTTLNAGSVTTPSSGNSALEMSRNLSTSDGGESGGSRKQQQNPPSPMKRVSIHPLGQAPKSENSEPYQGETKPRPRYLLSPLGSKIRGKSDSGKDCHASSPPLAAIGSSDYGSQDTSNSSTSPFNSNNNSHGATSPIHLRFPSITQDRPPRRDNSSVEDNYEWDSEIAMESEILEALRHFGALKKSGPVSDELLDELHKITKDTKNMPERQRAHSADILDSQSTRDEGEQEIPVPAASPGPNYSKESMARRCAALRAEFLHYQQLQELDEDAVT